MIAAEKEAMLTEMGAVKKAIEDGLVEIVANENAAEEEKEAMLIEIEAEKKQGC